jgi:hypothetical protein
VLLFCHSKSSLRTSNKCLSFGYLHGHIYWPMTHAVRWIFLCNLKEVHKKFTLLSIKRYSKHYTRTNQEFTKHSDTIPRNFARMYKAQKVTISL